MEQNELEIKRHSLAHVFAKAVKKLYPSALATIGPAIENGFYYDFDNLNISEDDFKTIENEMQKIIGANDKFERIEVSKEKALALFKDNPYKCEIINELEDGAIISVYKTGDDFVDLCRGPHVESAGKLQNLGFKAAKIAGAYWRGNEKNKMLTRVYFYAFGSKQELADYVHAQEEALKRDHRKIGKEQELFFFDDTAPGMAYWLPKGLVIFNTLVDFWREEHRKAGYQEFSGPQLNSSVLWKTSGHWDHYKEDMFVLTDSDGKEQALKPMSCPNSIKVFESKLRSYKDLPLRFNDVDVIHRNEKSGQLNGLFRVRMFRQDDSHNFIREDQIGSEIKEILKIAEKFYGIFNLPYKLTLSTRPDDFMGDINTWNKAEEELKGVLDEICGKNNYQINEGDGAFYGPKIDIKMKDCLGREWQMGTIQLDFQLPQRFNITYIDKNSEKKTPIMIHRVIYGSLERFIGIITEHFAGAFPVWLSPVQVKILNITDQSLDYANEIAKKLDDLHIRVEVDSRNEKISYKIREAQLEKVPYMLVIGDKEKENNTVSFRARGNRQVFGISFEEFVNEILEKIKTKSIN